MQVDALTDLLNAIAPKEMECVAGVQSCNHSTWSVIWQDVVFVGFLCLLWNARVVHGSGATLSFTKEGAVIAPPWSKLN
jgi:hypothetical protein